ncbi:MAG: response regulator transcription factor, partial [Gaiellaceae bacterium]
MSRILIAEDEARIASFLEKGLKANGFTTSVASDGRDAVALAATGRFDLLILDLGLPGKDGFTVLEELRAGGSHLPVLILSARGSLDDTVAGLEGGADDY